MTDLAPRVPHRPLTWTDAVLDLQESLSDITDPVYVVGGAVRDALMGRLIKDIDIATPGDSIQLARRIANQFPNGALYIMDQERGVARAIVETMHGSVNIDVARFRGDDGDILSDLVDRDFTINAMMIDLKGDLNLLIDPLMGEQDIATKTLRRCNPNAVSNDPIRALRAIRQSHQLNFRIEPDTLRDVRNVIDKLSTVSAERVRDEFFKILALPRPAAALRVMHAIDMLNAIIPFPDQDRIPHQLAIMDKLTPLLDGVSLAGTDNLAANLGYGVALVQLARVRQPLEDHLKAMWANDRIHRSLLMFAVLVQDFPPDLLEAKIESLRLSNAEKKRIMTVVAAKRHVYDLPDTTPLSLHRFWYPLSAAGVDVCLITLADYLATAGVELDRDLWLQLVEKSQIILEAYYLHHDVVVQPPPILDGNDLMTSLNLNPGKHIRDLLTTVREGQVTGDVQSKEDALRIARRLLNDQSL